MSNIADWWNALDDFYKYLIDTVVVLILGPGILGIWNFITRIRPNSARDKHIDPKHKKKTSQHHLYYSTLKINVVGYDDELRKLNDFLKCKDSVQWCLITGEGGTGKSKLCYDFMRSKKRKWYRPWGWQPCMPAKTSKGYTKDLLNECSSQLGRKTLFILDYAEYNTAEIIDWISTLPEGKNKKRKIRVILIQRRESTSRVFNDFFHKGYHFKGSPIALDNLLNEQSMQDLIDKYIKKYYKKREFLKPEEVYQRFVALAENKTTYVRPLYALMLVDALSENRSISCAKDILDYRLDHEIKTIRDSLANDEFTVSDNWYTMDEKTAIVLSAIATMIGIVPVEKTCASLGITLPTPTTTSIKKFSEISIFNNGNCEPIEPDIIPDIVGEYFVLRVIEVFGLEEFSKYIIYAWRNDEKHYMRSFMTRLLQERESSDSAFAKFSLDAFSTVIIRDSETEVATQSFKSHTYIKKLIIPSSVKHIGFEAFNGCDNLEEVVFEENSQLESIGTAAFYGCAKLRTINLSNTLTTIGSHAFEKCPLNLDVIVPASIINAGKFAFFGCDVTFPDEYDEDIKTNLLGRETLKLGNLIWDVLGERQYKGRKQKLIITHDVIEKRAFDAVTEEYWKSADYTGTNWHDCSLRAYLNNEMTVREYTRPDGTMGKIDYNTNGFLSRFSAEELVRICPPEENGIRIEADDNSSEGYISTNGSKVEPIQGKETIDKVFLLSTKDIMSKKYYQTTTKTAEEYWDWCRDNSIYLGATKEEILSGRYSRWFPKEMPMVENAIACNGEETWWWWLRSPGCTDIYAAFVDYGGGLYLLGGSVYFAKGGVRPALWLNL
ncbi:MAG: leucine-rich repeat domain-containing protein [Oscillospiraceae bacterium]|nr:leucine-rich repeat domain-containing protein [Oscillospiraceae bacterium]